MLLLVTYGDRDVEFYFGNLDDYLRESNSNGEQTFSGNRKTIREMVERRSKVMNEISSNGGNIHTWSLDFSDEFYNFISPLSDEKKVAIMEIYAEELNASAAAINQETAKIIAENESVEKTGAAIGQWIGAFILLIFILLIFGMFK